MTHELGHTECGGGGELLGTITIKIHDHFVLNVAVHLKHENLATLPQWDLDEALKLGKHIHKDIEGWYKKLEHKGVPAHYYEPFPENLEQEPQ